MYDADTYRKEFDGQYVSYIWKAYRTLKKLIPEKAQRVLSVGAGLGDIEALMQADVVCYDPHSPFTNFHEKPSGLFDYAFAHGAVISAIKPEEQRQTIDWVLSMSPAFLIHTGYKDQPHTDACMTYHAWDESELLSGLNWKRVHPRYLEVKNDPR